MKNPNRQAALRRAAAMKEGGESDTIIVYNSSNGSTAKYAEWLSEVLECDVVNYNRKNLAYVSLYRTVIFMGWIRAGEITRLSMLKQNYENFNLREKNLFIAGVGLGPHDSESYLEGIKKFNGLNAETRFYYLTGRYDPDKAKGVDKASLAAMSGTMYDGMAAEDAAVLKERLTSGYDGLDPENLTQLVKDILVAQKN